MGASDLSHKHIASRLSKRLLLMLVLGILITPVSSASIPEELTGVEPDQYIQLRVAAIDWCPQICPNEVKKGYVVELTEEVFKDSPYKLSIEYFPWSRAIRFVRDGTLDALLAPAQQEAPFLKYPNLAVGHQKMCFFTSKKANWQYQGVSSLKGMVIGVATDTSIEELNQYISNNPSQFQNLPYTERYVEQSAGKILKKRIDSFLMTLNTTKYRLKELNIFHLFKNAGCVSKANIYMAFTNQTEKRSLINGAINHFDLTLRNLSKSGYIQALHKKYNIE